MRRTRLMAAALMGSGFVAMAALPAYAGVISGSLWENANGGDATFANVPATTPDVTFTVPSPNSGCTGGLTLCFDSRTASNGYTIGGFLSTGNATIVTGGSESGNTFNNTLLYFTGDVSVTNGETFTVTHDDGLQLDIGGNLVVDAPGPTAPDVSTYTWGGASGTYAFKLVYGECCGAPAVLETSLPLQSSVPEPASLALFGSALFGMGLGAARRRRKHKQHA